MIRSSVKIFLFLFISIFTICSSAPILRDYERPIENDKFQLINYKIDIKQGRGRKYEGTLAITKPGNDRSWFRILSLIRKPVVDTPGCSLY